MQGIIDFFGHGICHQLPQRTFEAAGLYFPVCARDTGIHLGLALSVLAVYLLYRRQPRLPSALPPGPCVAAAVALCLPMAADGVSEYVGLRETSNLIRYATGAGAGLGIGVLASAVLMGFSSRHDPGRRVLERPGHALAALLCVTAALTLFYLTIGLLGAAGVLLALAALLADIGGVNVLVLGQLRRFGGRGGRRPWLRIIALSLVLTAAELAVLGLARDLVIDRLLGGQTLLEALL
jgi:uncharacterized membrane protein